jgi:hypothetical protein
MSFQIIEDDQLVSISVVRPSIVTADPRNSGPIYFSTGSAEPDVLPPGKRLRCLGKGSLELSGNGGQRFRVDAMAVELGGSS